MAQEQTTKVPSDHIVRVDRALSSNRPLIRDPYRELEKERNVLVGRAMICHSED